MADYISREKIAAEARELSTHLLNEWDTMGVLTLIDRQPAADVQKVRHGRWELMEYPYGQKTYICSECKDNGWWNSRYAYGDERFCPNCGAKMDESEDEKGVR